MKLFKGLMNMHLSTTKPDPSSYRTLVLGHFQRRLGSKGGLGDNEELVKEEKGFPHSLSQGSLPSLLAMRFIRELERGPGPSTSLHRDCFTNESPTDLGCIRKESRVYLSSELTLIPLLHMLQLK